MAEREFTLRVPGNRDDLVVTESDVFDMVRIDLGYEGFAVSRYDFEKMCKWFLKLEPYGPKRMQP